MSGIELPEIKASDHKINNHANTWSPTTFKEAKKSYEFKQVEKDEENLN